MDSCSAVMPSYTYALKGEKLLKSRGIPCQVKRNDSPASGGCGYSLLIYENRDKAAEILDRYKIPYTNITGGRGDG